MYGVTHRPPPYYYAFFDLDFIGQGTGLLASLYTAEGEWHSDIATEPSVTRDTSAANYITPFDHGYCLIGDAFVGDGSLAIASALDTLRVWDVGAATVYTYSAAAGLMVTHPLYSAGWLFWWETKASLAALEVPSYSLRKARADLTSDSTIGTIVWGSASALPRTPSSFIVQLSAQRARADFLQSGGHKCVSMTLVGTSQTTNTVADLDTPRIAGPSNTASLCIGPRGSLTNPAHVRTAPADETTTSTARWPTTGNWSLLANPFLSFGTSADRTTALAYGAKSGVGPWAVEAPTTATSGEPTRSISIQPHPDFGTEPPTFLYLMT